MKKLAVSYYSIKWIAFYCIYFLFNFNYCDLANIKNYDFYSVLISLFTVFIYLSIFPFIEIIITVIPLYLILSKEVEQKLGYIFLLFTLEFFTGYFLTVQEISLWLISKSIISIFCFLWIFQYVIPRKSSFPKVTPKSKF